MSGIGWIRTALGAMRGSVLVDGTTGLPVSTTTPLSTEEATVNGTPVVFRLTLAGAAENDTSANMAVNGSVTPQHFYRNAGSNGTIINRFVVVLDDAGASAQGSFGAISALTNGLTVGVHDGSSFTSTLMGGPRTNGELRETATQYDYSYFTSTSGGRQFLMYELWRSYQGRGLLIPNGSRLQVTVSDNITVDRLQFRCTGVDL